MSALEQALLDYLRLRRSLGHELVDVARLLRGFIAYLDAHDARTVTIDAALAWAQQPKTGTTVGPRRMTAARGFARYLAGVDANTEVPPLGLMPHRHRWRQPFIYSQADIDALMSQARCSIVSRLRAATYDTLIGLLAASGLRIGEAIKLDRSDVDWAEGVLLIRESKFGKSRLVPLHQQHARTYRLRPAPRRASAPAEGAELLRVPDPHTPALRRRVPDLPTARQQRRHRYSCTLRSEAARSTPYFRGPHPARVVSHRRGRPSQDPITVDLPGTSRTRLHLLVSVGRA